MIVLLYVDDLFVTGVDGLITDMKRNLADEHEMKELGMMHYFLGMEVWQNANGISLRQGKYALDILKRFKMMDYKAMMTPMASNLKLLSDASSEKKNFYHFSVYVFVTSECIHLYILCIVPQCLFQEVSIM